MRLLKYITLTALVSLFVASAAAAAAASLDSQISGLLGQAGSGTGAWVYDLEGGNVVIQKSADTKRTVASNEKIFTTAASLDRFGPDYRIETELYGAGALTEGVWAGDLYLKGHGDPSLGTDQFANRYSDASTRLSPIAGQLKKLGVEQVTGRIYGDESYFDSVRGVPDSGNRTSPYVGPLSALGLNNGWSNLAASLFQSKPPAFAASQLRALLKSSGIKVKRSASVGKAPKSAIELAQVKSPSMEVLIRRTNKPSNNYYAEMLAKGLGAAAGRGSTSYGAKQLEKFARKNGALLQAHDGSGLDRRNRTSPRGIGSLLIKLYKGPKERYKAFLNSLPISGRDGTLSSRMRSEPVKGNVFAKTGTLTGVSTLSGYLKANNGKMYAFSVLMNGVNAYTARGIQDRICQALVKGL